MQIERPAANDNGEAYAAAREQGRRMAEESNAALRTQLVDSLAGINAARRHNGLEPMSYYEYCDRLAERWRQLYPQTQPVDRHVVPA